MINLATLTNNSFLVSTKLPILAWAFKMRAGAQTSIRAYNTTGIYLTIFHCGIGVNMRTGADARILITQLGPISTPSQYTLALENTINIDNTILPDTQLPRRSNRVGSNKVSPAASIYSPVAPERRALIAPAERDINAQNLNFIRR